MKSLLILAAVSLLAACSSEPAASNAVAVNDVADAMNNAEEVPASEGETLPTEESSTQNDTDGPATQDRYIGRWIGVEGMYLNVAAKPSGGVTLDMQWDLDNRGKFDGSVTAEGLRFVRGGVAETAVPSDGDATGLKYLAGKKDCLTVKPGEGYCRD